MHLVISIEKNGKEENVGTIKGTNDKDASFCYDEKYLHNEKAAPISISLPLQEVSFSPERTRNFFEGLLPEGFTKKTVAKWIHTDEDNYLDILSSLGKECLGAIKIVDDTEQEEDIGRYEKLSLKEVRELAMEGATKSTELVTKSHLSLTGATGKVGLYYDEDTAQWYLPIGNAPSTHIVKQSHVRLDAIVTNEQLSILSAKKLGIEVPETFIINTGNFEDRDVLFATKRYDREFEGNKKIIDGMRAPLRIHQEDFGQALGIPASKKYEALGNDYLKKMFVLLKNHSANPIEDMTKLWNMVIFNFLHGNTDAHIKNFSLLYEDSLSTLRLAPAYDLVSTSVYKESTRNMAFNIGGEYLLDKINRSSFSDAAQQIELNQTFAIKQFDKMAEGYEDALRQAACELFETGYKNAKQIEEQILRTGGINNI